MKDYYAILGIPPNADVTLIKSVYRKQIAHSNPETVRDSQKKLAHDRQKELNEAYDVLSDPVRRQEYDQAYCASNAGEEPEFQLLLPKAGFPLRVISFLIDFAIVAVPLILISALLHLFNANNERIIIEIAVYIAFGIYAAICLPRNGQTIGKRVIGLKVIGVDGKLITAKDAFIRCSFGYLLGSILFNIGFLSVAWDPQKQGWHDSIGPTFVVRRHATNWHIAAPVFIVSVAFLTWLIHYTY